MVTVSTLENALEEDQVVVPDEVLHEVHGGQIVELSPMGSYPVEVASILHEYLAPFVRNAGLGRAIVEDLFRIDPTTQYRPDVAFVSYDRWPRGRRSPNSDPWNVIPDLVVEVISKSDQAWDVMAKVRHYFEAGVRAAWLVYPNLEIIHVFESFTQIRVLTRADVLEGGEVVPGFQLPLASLFEEELEGPVV